MAKDLENTSEAIQTMRESLRRSIASTIRNSVMTSDLPKVNSVLGHIQGVDLQGDRPYTAEQAEDMSTMAHTIDRPGKLFESISKPFLFEFRNSSFFFFYRETT